jgi:hypothetical protein
VPVAKDGLDLLSKISSQGGFVLKDVLQLNGYTIGGTVSGSIAGNNTDPAGSSTVLLKTRWMFGNNANAVRIYQTDYINIAIHEMLHLSGRYSGYDDTQLATAARMLPGAAPGLPAPPKDNNDTLGIIRNSDYYHNELMKHCGPR